MVEAILKDHDHHVILDAFKRLQNDNRIIISHSKMGRGRRQDFFIITKKGLTLLVVEAAEPWKFWRAMMGYSFHSKRQITVEEVKEFYGLFIDKYLKYPSEYGYCFDLDHFNIVCRDWLQNRIQTADRITLDQIVLESLAINPALTLKQLVQSIRGFGVDEIKRILSYYTPIRRKPVVIDETYVDDYRSGKIYTIKRWELLLHYAIKVKHNAAGVETYELSLFGVLFIMLILRHHDMGKLKYSLYYKNESFEKYYDKIASNYQSNVPLIFGKWYLLKKILKIFAAYNFDIILEKETRDKAMQSLSVTSDLPYNEPEQVSISSGNKDLYESAKSIEQITYKQLGEIQVRGMEESSNFTASVIHSFPDKTIGEARRFVRHKTNAVFQLIDEITVLLDPLRYDPESFREEIVNHLEEEGFVDATQAERLSILHGIDTLEKSFANQISFRYYLNLNNEHYFQVMHQMNYYPSRAEEEEYLSSSGIRLFSILRDDDDLNKWFLSWIEKLECYQKETLSRTSNLHKEIAKLMRLGLNMPLQE